MISENLRLIMTKKTFRDVDGADKSHGAETSRFPVVGIGASAGGFAAARQLLAELANDTGMAFVLVQHLNPAYHSNLAELLGDGPEADFLG